MSARHYDKTVLAKSVVWQDGRPICINCGKLMSLAGKTSLGAQRWKCQVGAAMRVTCSRYNEPSPYVRSAIMEAHGGSHESVRRELESSKAHELVEKYKVKPHTVGQLERRLKAWCLRECIKCSEWKPASQMRRTKHGNLAQICLGCDPRKPASSTHARRLDDETRVPGVMWARVRMSPAEGINGVFRSRRVEE